MTISDAISQAPKRWDKQTVNRWANLWKEVEKKCAPSVIIPPACVAALTQIFPYLTFADDAETILSTVIDMLKSMESLSAKTAWTT